ncbi:Ig-like protein group 2 [Jatrophihabitans sp. GAS493]|uniref:DUF4082 domain-containing protein n=1 Tax=Jatrophihabitans sp. GAS493 TaxID=1907575 RepID=UPI000BB8D1DF|nr:DUF4082 domain-containing protein [Jatrophihabitans sp. GAS493]SOD72609.1 Ig-like protein group 2 [Jatrophihabitans sp. GAS493]
MKAARALRPWLMLSSILSASALVLTGLAVPAVADANNCPCTLFTPADGPLGGDVDSGDDSSVELGVQFTVTAPEPITAVRFFKAAGNTGTHVGSLWTATGTLLAQVTFSNESSDGWQQANFSTPVLATPGNVYVASYFAPDGHYSFTHSYFGSASHDSGILHAPGGDPTTPNGVFVYTPQPAFPTGSYNSTNYWVDVVADGAAPAPTLSSLSISPQSLNGTKGESAQLTATGTYSDASTADLTGQVTWSSADPSVATVSSGGLVSAVGTGTTTVTATLDGVTSSVPTTVRGPTVTGVTVTGVPASLAKGATRQLTATARYSDGTTANVTAQASWSSSEPAVAGVSAGGLLTATGIGTSSVSASFGGATGSGSVSVTAAVLTSLSITPANAHVRVLQVVPLHASATYSDGTSVNITTKALWWSSSPFIAIVGSGPLVGGLLASLICHGTSSISVSYGGLNAATNITVG